MVMLLLLLMDEHVEIINFLSINGSVVPKGEPVIYFPVPLDGSFNNHTYTQAEKDAAKQRGSILF